MDRGEGADLMAAATDGLEHLEDMIVRQAEATGAQVAAAKAAIGNVIFGQDPVVEQALITVLCGGHALLIGLPGLAKTKLVETMGIVLGLEARDRKSTRLNSSHQIISYAVFCLKKKNKPQQCNQVTNSK